MKPKLDDITPQWEIETCLNCTVPKDCHENKTCPLRIEKQQRVIESSGSQITVSLVAAMLGVERRQVFYYIWNGKLPAKKVSDMYIIEKKDVEKLLEGRRKVRYTI